jgi:hypothetical protein
LRILLIGPLLVLVLRLLTLVRSLLVLIRPLLILVLPLLVLVAARRILGLAGSALLPGCTWLVLTEACPHGRTGVECCATLTLQASRVQTENQDRSGDNRRPTHSVRVPGPVHNSFS